MKLSLSILLSLVSLNLCAQLSDWLPKGAALYYKFKAFGYLETFEIYEFKVEEAISTDSSEIRILSTNCSQCSGVNIDQGFFERVGPRVYYVSNIDSVRYMLYNFAAEVGDTVHHIGHIDAQWDNEFGSYVVTAIDEIEVFDSIIHRRYIESPTVWQYIWLVYDEYGAFDYLLPQYGLADPGIGPLIAYYHPTKGYHCFQSPFCAQVMIDSAYLPFRDLTHRLYRMSENEGDFIFGVGIDSVYTRADTVIIVPNISVTDSLDYDHPTSNDCFSIDGGWMFHRVEIYLDWKVIFKTGDAFQALAISGGDEVLIDTRAGLGETWIAAKFMSLDGDTIVVRATVSDLSMIDVLGKMDSVKTISFSSNKTDHFDQFYLQLGKTIGLVSAVNFRQFTNIEAKGFNNPYDNHGNFPLVGKGNIGNGVRNLTWLDVWMFQEGDIIHTTDFSSDHPEGSRFELRAWHILERDYYVWGIDYVIEEQSQVILGNQVMSYSKDTITRSFKEYPEFDQLPGTFVFDNGVHAYYRQTSSLHGPAKCMDSEPVYEVSEDCVGYLYIDGCLSCPLYIKGLGGGYYYCLDFFGKEYHHMLRYYKKDTVEWGSPLNFTVSVDDPQSSPLTTSVFPNPVSNQLFLKDEVHGLSHINILDITGVVQKSLSVTEPSIGIDVSTLPQGMYIIQFFDNNDRLLMTSRFVIQR